MNLGELFEWLEPRMNIFLIVVIAITALFYIAFIISILVNSKGMVVAKKKIIKTMAKAVDEPLYQSVHGWNIKMNKKMMGTPCYVGYTDSYLLLAVLEKDYSFCEEGLFILPTKEASIELKKHLIGRNYKVKVILPNLTVTFTLYKRMKEDSMQETQVKQVMQHLNHLAVKCGKKTLNIE